MRAVGRDIAEESRWLNGLHIARQPSGYRKNSIKKGSLNRREKLIERLEDQKLLLNDPTHVRIVQRLVKVDGEKQPVEKKQRVSPWWRTDFNGQYVMSIKFGSKPVEFEKGKAGIAAPNKEKLFGVIDTLIAAVRAGELDDLLGQAAKLRAAPKAKKAA